MRFHKFYQFLVNLAQKVSYFIPEAIKFSEVTIFSEDTNKCWLRKTMKEIKKLIKNKAFLVQYPEKFNTLTPSMDSDKANIHSDGSLDKLKLRIVV